MKDERTRHDHRENERSGLHSRTLLKEVLVNLNVQSLEVEYMQ
jgi:hypothetical protein